MPTHKQYQTVKQQVFSFAKLEDTLVKMEVLSFPKMGYPSILIINKNKSWRFSDPDWDVVIRQLARLYRVLKKRGVECVS